MANTAQLLSGLEEYQRRLLKHTALVADEYVVLEKRWAALDEVFASDAADQFRVSWQQTNDTFRAYMLHSQKITRLLEQRIAFLRELMH